MAIRHGTAAASALAMPGIISYRDLTTKYPPDERFGLTSHTRKSAVSVPSNIAEGTRHKSAGYVNRVIIALGEHAELETQMIIGYRLGYIDEADARRFDALSTSVGQLTHGLLRSLDSGW